MIDIVKVGRIRSELCEVVSISIRIAVDGNEIAAFTSPIISFQIRSSITVFRLSYWDEGICMNAHGEKLKENKNSIYVRDAVALLA